MVRPDTSGSRRPSIPARADTRIERETQWLVEQLLWGTPREVIVAHRILTDRYLPWFQRRAVRRAVADGISWTGVGRLLGVTRQAVQQRFSGGPTIVESMPPSLRDPGSPLSADGEYERLQRRWVSRRRDAAAEADDQAVPW